MEAAVARVRFLAIIISEWLSTGFGIAASEHIATRQTKAKASLYSESPRGDVLVEYVRGYDFGVSSILVKAKHNPIARISSQSD
jgi:hypothetical protein